MKVSFTAAVLLCATCLVQGEITTSSPTEGEESAQAKIKSILDTAPDTGGKKPEAAILDTKTEATADKIETKDAVAEKKKPVTTGEEEEKKKKEKQAERDMMATMSVKRKKIKKPAKTPENMVNDAPDAKNAEAAKKAAAAAKGKDGSPAAKAEPVTVLPKETGTKDSGAASFYLPNAIFVVMTTMLSVYMSL